MTSRWFTRLTVAVAAAFMPALAGATTLQSIEADGTQFKVTFTDGRVLRSPDLVGATLTVAVRGNIRRMRIDAVETDPGVTPDRSAPDVYLHTLSVEAADGSWENICSPIRPDAVGVSARGPRAGRQHNPAGGAGRVRDHLHRRRTGQVRALRLSRRGDAPDRNPGHDLYNACVRMVRADYAGDGKGTTRDGQPIDLYDRFGIQRPDNDPAFEFEAGWGKDGAVCVRHVRVKDNVTLDALEQLDQLRGRTGEICTEEFARRHGAVLFNRSPP